MKKLILAFHFLIPLFAFGQSADGTFKTLTATMPGTDTYMISEALPASYDAKEKFIVVFPFANTTTSPTLNRHGLGAKAIKNEDGTNPAIGAICACRKLLSYNGTYFQLIGGSGGGITNSAANHELTVSNGTDIIGSGIFNPSLGIYNFGSGLAATTINLYADGSSSDVSLGLNAKGFGSILLNAVNVQFQTSASFVLAQNSNFNYLGISNTGFGSSSNAAGNSGNVTLFSGGATGGNSGDITLQTGTATGSQGNINLNAPNVNVNSSPVLVYGANNTKSGNATTLISSSGNIGSNNGRFVFQQINGTASLLKLETSLSDTYAKSARLAVTSSGTVNNVSITIDNNSTSNTNRLDIYGDAAFSSFLFTDAVRSRGAEYAADYSANFVDRSLIDLGTARTKSIVNQSVSISTNTFTLNLNSYSDVMFYNTTAITANCIVALSNATNGLRLGFSFKLNGTNLTMTFPNTFTMLSNDPNWNPATQVYTFNGTFSNLFYAWDAKFNTGRGKWEMVVSNADFQ